MISDCGAPSTIYIMQALVMVGELGISKGHLSLEYESLSQGYEKQQK